MGLKNIIFKIGDEKYGIDITRIREIENADNIVPVPNSPACVLGIMHLRDNIIPIYSLRRKFNKHDYEDVAVSGEVQKLIIVATKEAEVGFLVDSVEEIVEVEYSNLHTTPLIVKSDETAYIDRVAYVNKEIIILLNVDSVISDEEMDDITTILEDM